MIGRIYMYSMMICQERFNGNRGANIKNAEANLRAHEAWWMAACFSKAASADGNGARLRFKTPCRKEIATP